MDHVEHICFFQCRPHLLHIQPQEAGHLFFPHFILLTTQRIISPADLLNAATQAGGCPVLFPHVVDNLAFYAFGSIRIKTNAPLRHELFHRIDEPQHTITDQIVIIGMGAVEGHQAAGNTPHQKKVM
ncbi:hypothetical protein SDC9_167307 [bioreactor metagenome]|uniref:Uncharacterized protein n=1 Tax=bioreactor metagenome TaxID=1076179 RepID=A0A645G1W8_9ZZZZ